MVLFELGKFRMHSGEMGEWKIECDALTDDDWKCLAYIIAERQNFKKVVGIATGGLNLADALKRYEDSNSKIVLIVDDVLTTGNSMDAERTKYSKQETIGWIVFARGRCPSWINALFKMD